MKFKKKNEKNNLLERNLCQLKSQHAEIAVFAITVLPINSMESFSINLNIRFYVLVLNHKVTEWSGSLFCWQLRLGFPRQDEAYETMVMYIYMPRGEESMRNYVYMSLSCTR